jgi:hypothetical protein
MVGHRFRYIASDGVEHSLTDSQALLEAIRAGALLPTTMLFDGLVGHWGEAKESQAYILARRLHLSDQAVVPGEEGGHSIDRPSMAEPLTGASIAAQSRPVPQLITVVPKTASSTPLTRLVTSGFVFTWLIAAIREQYTQGHDAGYSLGYVLGQGLLLWLLGALAARYLGRGRPGVAWVVVSGLFAVSGIGAYVRAERFRDDALAAMSTMAQSGEATTPLPVDADTLTLNYALGRFVNAANAAWAQYNRAVADAGEGYLAPKALVTSAGRGVAKANIDNLRIAADTLALSLHLSIQDTHTRLLQLEAAREEYRGLAAGFDKGVPAMEQLISHFVAVERNIMAVADSLVGIAQTDPPELGADGNTVLFARNWSISEYNRLTSRIQKLAAEEAQAVEALKQANRQSVHLADSMRTHL